MRALLIVALSSSVCGCAQGTFVTLSIDQQVTTPATARVDLQLALAGRSATTTLGAHGGAALVFPTTASLQIGAGAGPMSVTAIAYDATGNEVDRGSASVPVVANADARTTLTLGGAGTAATDMAGLGDGGSSAAVPSAPTSVTASSGNAQATVTWAPPASSGTSAIASYTVVSAPGGVTVETAGNATTATIAGLTNGTTYTFAVAATNASGTGPAAVSNGATPTATPMVPAAPTSVTATANVDSGATIAWTASDNHGAALQGYSIVATQLTGTLATAGPTATSAIVGGLTPGAHYTFTITATNSVGTSVASLASSPITAATSPGAPTAVSAAANIPDGATVSWKAPASDGFAKLLHYTATASPGGMTGVTADGTSTSVQVKGLTAGTAYTFTVVATNVIGDGPAAGASAPVTVLPQLAAPANVVACNIGGTVTVRFDPVAGALSYDVFYGTAEPATSGTKVNLAAGPATITLAAGTFYFAVAAVNGAGDGVPSADQKVANDGQVHDTAFAISASGVDIYDCFSTIASGSAPTRTMNIGIPGFGPTSAAIAVDSVNSVIWVADYASYLIDGWNDANLVNGVTSTAPDYQFRQLYAFAIAIDDVHKKLYVSSGSTTTISRYGYTTPDSLNGTVTPEATFNSGADPSAAPGVGYELDVNRANGDLWVAFGGGGGSGGAGLFPAAHDAADMAVPTKLFNLSAQGGAVGYYGLTYWPANGGTIAVSDGSSTLSFLTGVDALTGGNVPATSTLSASPGALTNGNGLFVIGDTAQVTAWSESSLTGNALKTLTGGRTYQGVTYVP